MLRRQVDKAAVRHRTVLSTIFLGLGVIDGNRTVLAIDDINAAVRYLLQRIAGFLRDA